MECAHFRQAEVEEKGKMRFIRLASFSQGAYIAAHLSQERRVLQ